MVAKSPIRHKLSVALVVAVLWAVSQAIPGASGSVGATMSSTPTPIWHVHLNATGASTLEDVSCASPKFCTAVGWGLEGRAAIFRTNDGGTTWSREIAPPQTVALSFVSCPTAEVCVAAGYGPYSPSFIATTNGGRTWLTTASDIGRDDYNLQALVCPSASECIAVGNEGFGFSVSTDQFKTWTTTTSFDYANISPDSVSCPSVTTCYVVLNTYSGASTNWSIVRTINSGHSFSPVASGAATPSANLSISCSIPTSCTATGLGATGTVVESTTDGGTKWKISKLPPTVSPPLGLSCNAPGICTAVVPSSTTPTSLMAASTFNGGTTWSLRHIATNATSTNTAELMCNFVGTCFGNGSSITCSHLGACLVVGYGIPSDSVIASRYTDGSWRHVSLPIDSTPLSSVSCPTTTLCVAVGYAGLILRSFDGGRSWISAATHLGTNVDLNGVACSNATICVTLGSLQRVSGVHAGRVIPVALNSSNGGATWRWSRIPRGVDPFSSVACPTSTTCVATLGADTFKILRTTDGGATWKTQYVRPDSGSSFYGVSCGSSTHCVAVGWIYLNGYSYGVSAVSTDAGVTWQFTSNSEGLGLDAVSCTTPTTCFAVGVIGLTGPGTTITGVFETVDGGKHWSARDAPANSIFSDTAITCVASRCEELATSNASFGPLVSSLSTTIDGAAKWSTAVLPSTDVVLTAVARTTSGRWVVVGGNSNNGPLVLTSP